MEDLQTIQKYGFNLVPVFVDGPVMNKNKDKSEKNYTLNRNWTEIDIDKGNINTEKYYPRNKAYAIRTGKISNITGVDVDDISSYPNCEIEKLCNKINTLTIATPNGGKHYIFKYIENLKTITGLNEHIDIRNDGACLYGAGTKTTNGNYKIINDVEPKQMSEEILDKLLGFYPTKSNDKKRNITDENDDNNYFKTLSYNELEELINAIPSKYADNYNDWTTIGWCIANLSRKNNFFNDGFGIFDKFSSQSLEKYDEEACKNLYFNSKSTGVGFTTLNKYLPPETKVPTQLNHLVDIAVASMGTHYDVAVILSYYFGDILINDSVKQDTGDWFKYSYEEHRWVHLQNEGLITPLISTFIYQLFIDRVKYYTDMAMNQTNSENSELFKEKASRSLKIAHQCKMTPFKKNIMSELRALKAFKPEMIKIDKENDKENGMKKFSRFEEVLDTKEYLVGMLGGVLDAKKGVFRDGKPEDYISYSTYQPYIEYNEEDAVFQEMDKFFIDLLPNVEVKIFLLQTFACVLFGVKYEIVPVLLGEGSNGKSRLMSLLEKAFSDYFCILPISLLTNKRASSNSAQSELERTKGRRFAVLQEPSNDDKINVGLMKELSGNDTIQARTLFKTPIEFKPQFKMFLTCNKLPEIPSNDNGTWRRIRLIDFITKFQDVVDENETDVNVKPIDFDLNEKIDKWAPYLISYLFHIFKQLPINNADKKKRCLPTNKHVDNITLNYRNRNDTIGLYITERIQINSSDNNTTTSLKTIYNDYSAWHRQFVTNKPKTPYNDFETILLQKLGPYDKKTKAWKVYIKYDDDTDDEEDNKPTGPQSEPKEIHWPKETYKWVRNLIQSSKIQKTDTTTDFIKTSQIYQMFLTDFHLNEDNMASTDIDIIKKSLVSNFNDNSILTKTISKKKDGKVVSFKAYVNLKISE